jgi:hypothetical protein
VSEGPFFWCDDWFVAKAVDADAFESFAARTFQQSFGSLHESASPQAFFLKGGSLAESARLRDALQSWTTGYCDNAQALQAFTTVKPKNYRFREDGKVWYIENTSHDFGLDWGIDDWAFHYKRKDEWSRFDLKGSELVRFTNLFPYLNGNSTYEDVLRIIQDQRIESVRALLDSNLIYGINVETEDNSSRIEYLGHAGVYFRSGRCSIAVDPLAGYAGRSTADLSRFFQLLNRIDAIFFSHAHWDHCQFQTVSRISRSALIYVPKVAAPSLANPPLKSYLESLGFTRVIELSPWEHIELSELTVSTVPFFGESFGANSHFDGLTFFVKLRDVSVYLSVDTSFDECGSMDDVFGEFIPRGLSSPQIWFAGFSGQHHEVPMCEGGARIFSNEVDVRGGILKYHADLEDVLRWSEHLKPRLIIPYANFGRGNASERKIFDIGAAVDAGKAFSESIRQLTLHGGDVIRFL